MLKKRAFMMIFVSLMLGVLAAWMAGNWIQRADQDEETQMASVVAANIAIPFGTRVERRHLKTLELPANVVPPGSFSSIDDVVSRVTVQPIVAGEILMRGRFVDDEEGSTLAAMIDKQKRAVTVRVDDVIGVAGDVLAARREANRRASAETVLRDVKVLAVDQTAATEKNEPVIVRAVTLEVTPQQAETLVKAREEGSIQLTLRNPLEDDAPAVAEEPESAPEPARPAPRAVSVPRQRDRDVTVIRGTAVSTAKTKS